MGPFALGGTLSWIDAGVPGRLRPHQLGAEEAGLDELAWMPNGAISEANTSMKPSTPNFDATYAVRESPVDVAPGGEGAPSVDVSTPQIRVWLQDAPAA